MTFEITLEPIAMHEYALLHCKSENQDFKNFMQTAIILLGFNHLYFYESELLEKNRSSTMAEVLKSNPGRFFPGGGMHKGAREYFGTLKANRKEGLLDGDSDKDYENVWFDLWDEDFKITPNMPFFDIFIIYQLRHLDILLTDSFLNYQMNTYFKNDSAGFKRLVVLSIRKHGAKLLKEDQMQTIQEWIAMAEAPSEPSIIEEGTEDEQSDRIKGRIQREQGDKLTSLSLVQTALLIQFMQEERIILKGTNLTYTHAGKAFNILTGYSAHTLRQQLGTKGEIEGVKHEDYKELHEIIIHLAKLIEDKIHKK